MLQNDSRYFRMVMNDLVCLKGYTDLNGGSQMVCILEFQIVIIMCLLFCLYGFIFFIL